MATAPRIDTRFRRIGLARPVDPSARVTFADEFHGGFLEDGCRRLEAEDLNEAATHLLLADLFLALHSYRLRATYAEWGTFTSRCRQHRIIRLLHQDPLTRRAFRKPRGYAGDALMLDYIYGREENWPPPRATRLGRHIFNFTTLAPASSGVRARRGYVADWIDQVAAELTKPKVLSVAAGHLREAELASAVKRRKLGRFTALDADESSLLEVQRCYADFGVNTIHGGIRDLISGKLQVEEYDVIYSMGLFDYLGAATARRLVSVLFQFLRPGGRLMVANFLPGIRDVGYMEIFMDWNLIYRDRQDMVGITMEVPQSQIRELRIVSEENQNIIFAEMRKV
jgi:SAM-dependent methyltransferase